MEKLRTMIMKRFLLALAVSLAVTLPAARAGAVADTLPFLSSLRHEVTNQLTIQSNLVAAATNKAQAKLPKSLAGKLKLALRTIDRTKTNYAAGAKTLSTLNKSFARSALSNEFNPLLDATFDQYIDALNDEIDDAEDRINAAYPGRSRDAALKALARMIAYVDSATTNTNFLRALKALGSAAKGEALVEKATVRAENAPLPPAQYKATINGAIYGNFNFTPKVVGQEAFAAVHSVPLNNLIMNGVNGVRSGSGFSTKITMRTLTITIPNLVDGTTTYPVGTGSGHVSVIYSVSKGGVSGVEGADGYTGTSGTLTVTVNKAAKTAVGTFSFTAPGENTPTTASTSNGSFSIVWVQ